MNKIIKYNDFIQINPDKRIFALDKSEKVKIIDNILTRSNEGGKGLVITYDLSHSGRKINNRIYSVNGQKKGIESLTNPYPKPILKNHDQMGEPIGRFISGEWQDLKNEAYQYMSNKDSFYSINDAFLQDDPMKIYKMLKNNNLLNDKKWPGLGRMRVQANITDEKAIKKFMDGRYFTFSAGSTTDRHVCSICESDWIKDGMCEHRHGKEYDGETCVFITGDFIVMEGSVVNTPADDLSQIVHMELTDEESSNKNTDYLNNIEQIILTDSIFNLGENYALQNSVQDTKQIDTPKEKNHKEEEKKDNEKEIVDKEYDHSMSLSNKAMIELHDKGVTYVTQSAADQKMVIRITYSGSVKNNSTKDSKSIYIGCNEKESIFYRNPILIEENLIDRLKESIKKDFNMSDTIDNIIANADTKEEEVLSEEQVLPTEVLENNLEEQVQDESLEEEETLDQEDLDIDWDLFDLALTGLMQDKALTTEQRKELPDDAFCGPNRSFPVPDCEHITAARRLIGQAKASGQTKAKIMACVNSKSGKMDCEKSKDYLQLEQQFDELKKQHSLLSEKLALVVQKLEEKNISSSNDEKMQEVVENSTQDKVNNSNVINLKDQTVESPSVHSEEEIKTNSKPKSQLGSFEQKIVDMYNDILKIEGKDAARNYLNSKASYLPRGFDPSNF